MKSVIHFRSGAEAVKPRCSGSAARASAVWGSSFSAFARAVETECVIRRNGRDVGAGMSGRTIYGRRLRRLVSEGWAAMAVTGSARLALASVLQHAENLSDRQAAEAVRCCMDWKHCLGLKLDDPGFAYSVLSEFRVRTAEGDRADRLLAVMIDHLVAAGLVSCRARVRTDPRAGCDPAAELGRAGRRDSAIGSGGTRPARRAVAGRGGHRRLDGTLRAPSPLRPAAPGRGRPDQVRAAGRRGLHAQSAGHPP
ncbi:hypothetical protein CK936_16760 [Streptomyces albireticuli]|uniref:Transposase InsH N-terminal domain-containing protein n=1 Tax=Streptomyces albireticuli TaxID=1940 RepID=A0A2A2D5N9_9ACTN|nr:hypothetical protein CK936_16760 [Streptomyces albireticuli]